MRSTRRQFVQQSSIGAVLLTQAGAGLSAETSKPWMEAGDLTSHMQWLNAPAAVSYGPGTVTAKSRPKTDFWRKTFYGYITDNGHFFHLPVFGDFTLQARVNGKYAALYDQAGLMVRLDEKRWMKCGTELVVGKRWASVVFTHDFSDWSTMEDLSQSEAVWWRVARKKDSIEAQCSMDGVSFVTIRQGYFPPGVEVQAGIMCAAPEGAGFEATFDKLSLHKP
jgi:regulation of enolase protein 1 (concanavalin A-like superfamily)